VATLQFQMEVDLEDFPLFTWKFS